MKKILSLTLACILFALSLTALSSCNVIQPGKLSDIAGTYVLDEYKITTEYDNQGNKIEVEDRPVVDKIEEYGIKEYFVISESGYGYHVYRDNETAVICKQVKQVYEYDDEDPELIEKVTFYDGESEFEFYIQSKKHTMTNNENAWHSELKLGKRTIPLGRNESVSMRYKRVSRNQDLKNVEKELGVSLSGSPFLAAWIPEVLAETGSKSGDNIPYEDLFIYNYYVVDRTAMTATHYYALTADGEEKTETLALSYDLSTNTFQMGETVYTSYLNNNALSFNRTRSEVESGEVVNYYYTLDRSFYEPSELEGAMADAMESYRSTRQQ